MSSSFKGAFANLTYVKESFSQGCYEGSKMDGLRNGYGTYYYSEGGKYCGDWLTNKMHGKGTLYYADGRIAYQGEWKNDCLDGWGILYNEKPVSLTQPYDYQCFDQAEESWVYYEGPFRQDDKSGNNGRLVLSNGERYEGDFKNDMVDGKGIFYTLDNKKILGEWEANRLVRVITSVSSSQCD